jgi:type II secretory pathway component PulC
MVETAAAHPQVTEAGSGNKFFSLPAGSLSLQSVNRVLMVLTALAFVYFMLTLLTGTVRLMGVGQHIHKLEAKGAKMAASASADREFVKSKPADPMLENRNIFQPAGSVAASVDSTVSLTGAAAYKLVGISMAKEASETYVMVENAQTKLTYFLQYGQPVEGLELEKILEDKVIVKIGGKTVELE